VTDALEDVAKCHLIVGTPRAQSDLEGRCIDDIGLCLRFLLADYVLSKSGF
jgi:hypothetical protein